MMAAYNQFSEEHQYRLLVYIFVLILKILRILQVPVFLLNSATLLHQNNRHNVCGRRTNWSECHPLYFFGTLGPAYNEFGYNDQIIPRISTENSSHGQKCF